MSSFWIASHRTRQEAVNALNRRQAHLAKIRVRDVGGGRYSPVEASDESKHNSRRIAYINSLGK